MDEDDEVEAARLALEATLGGPSAAALYAPCPSAQARFGKSAADLNEREAALLAAVLPSPNRYRLDPPGPYVRKQAGTYQARMRVVQNEGLDACVFKGET